ncbi:NADPH:quinone oxidoreductase [Pseudomonas amygdali pv. eriobotryae]|uniref:Alcohol dehydrogenase n=3 Tax=Pseudomonas TaxID=286 RepID=A0A9X0GXS9_PSESX|nr:MULTISPECIES: NAD(P)-dependent alcohol dehydrogenase [Pseudomonas syringae group]KPX03822.1 putative alcohol dehydrogenase [Pseudomonas syringae pv. daphniphylli]KPY44498.1 putative alcohol dehydrogenase [Pseudomonas syringae pv. rhaphiolepidis]KWS35495.1 alcohol dehydrogenase [Pseudomonas syringae pv. rhaphiolepidis]KWS83558.1 alcohol dehydrogenase [Pseudomonas syringae pv. daphniphylli]UPT39543.1 NAD(P)-dependent alcohol dehydrogenase [Pseudomonas amygdali pv. loropetali]
MIEPDGPGQAIVAPRLVSLISRDVQILHGVYGARQEPERIPVSEGVGEVIAVGEGVSQVKVGDRVICGHSPDWLEGPFRIDVFAHDVGVTHDGWLADKDVAALASAGLTAWNALMEVCKVKPGELVLCLGTGGVALAALKLARLHGARVAITSSSDEKLDIARQLGADITINYRTHPDWAAQVMALTNNTGADVILETGGQDTLGQSIAAAAVNGRIAVIGVTPEKHSPIPDYLSLILKNVTIRGIANGSRAMFVDLIRAIEANGVETVVARTFKFADAPQAYAYFAAAKHIGKVLIEFERN